MSIKKDYDAWSDQYDSNSNKTRDLDAISTSQTLSKYAFDFVLELGCGTAKNTPFFLSRAKKVIGIDFSEGMLQKARQKVKDARCKFIKADIMEDWPVENGSIDLISSNLVLEHIEDLNPIFEKTNQKLRSGGLFFISELHPFKQYNGSGAQFDTTKGKVELEVFTHNLTDFTRSAQQNGFSLLEINEWFDDGMIQDLPRLITFVFKKE